MKTTNMISRWLRSISGGLAVTAMLGGALGTSGCYRYAFDQEPVTAQKTSQITYSERKATWVGGLVGTGRVDTRRYCDHPIRTETKITAKDALFTALTLFIYTPQTLYVTCPVPSTIGRR